MRLLERNYQGSLQAYLIHEDREEAKSLLKSNLLSRLSKLVGNDLNEEERDNYLLPNVTIRVIKISDKYSDKSIYLGGLTHSRMKFPATEGELDSDVNELFRNSGVDLPTSELLDEKLDKTFSSGIYLNDPFKLTNLVIEHIPCEFSDSEYTFVESFDSIYSNSEISQFKVLKSVSLLALDKFVRENPEAPKDRLFLGVENLVKQVNDEKEKLELKTYLISYINNINQRPLLVEESNLIIKANSKSGNTIKLWKIAAVVGVILAGAIIYNQRKRIKDAWDFSKEANLNENKGESDSGRNKAFFKTLFTPSGRSISREYMNNKRENKASVEFLKDWGFKKTGAELSRDVSSFKMKESMNKYYKK